MRYQALPGNELKNQLGFIQCDLCLCLCPQVLQDGFRALLIGSSEVRIERVVGEVKLMQLSEGCDRLWQFRQ